MNWWAFHSRTEVSTVWSSCWDLERLDTGNILPQNLLWKAFRQRREMSFTPRSPKHWCIITEVCSEVALVCNWTSRLVAEIQLLLRISSVVIFPVCPSNSYNSEIWNLIISLPTVFIHKLWKIENYLFKGDFIPQIPCMKMGTTVILKFNFLFASIAQNWMRHSIFWKALSQNWEFWHLTPSHCPTCLNAPVASCWRSFHLNRSLGMFSTGTDP